MVASLPTVKELIDQNKVALDALLIQLAKVAARNGDKTVEKLKHERRVGVAPVVVSNNVWDAGRGSPPRSTLSRGFPSNARCLAPRCSTHFVTAVTKTLLIFTWKKLVLWNG